MITIYTNSYNLHIKFPQSINAYKLYDMWSSPSFEESFKYATK